MRTTGVTVLFLVCGLAAWPAESRGRSPADRPAAVVERFALVVGANLGGSDRPVLKYAVSDAEHFAGVIVDLGGVAPANAVLLKQPKLGDFLAALDQVRARAVQARRAAAANGGGRVEVFVYYSGHADEKGLLLGEDRYSYQSLRDRLDEIPADVRICVLDACASGAFTRLKGGRVRQPFLVDQSAEVSGHAFVTSSSETETAQESDRLGASYFTYYLISGLRGAADLSGEGKVTLNEAYQFAYNETLGRTVDTRGGAQHPRYEIDLSGTGDVIITDLRQTTATLVLAEPLDGRVFVRNAAHHLVVELYKPRGRRVELGLEPGAYEVRVERPASALLARSQLLDGGRVVLDLGQFGPTTPEATRRRGGLGPDYTVSGRTRLGLRMGTWRVGARSGQTIISSSGSRSAGLLAGLQYAHFFGENLAVTVNANVLPLDSGSFVTSDGWFDGSATVVALPIGLRWTPAMKDLRTRWAKPFLAIGVGPVVGSLSGSGSTADGAISGSQTYTTIGGHLGAGVDFHLSGRWSIELGGGYNWMLDFARPLRGRRNYAGIDFGASIGRLFGGGSQTR